MIIGNGIDIVEVSRIKINENCEYKYLSEDETKIAMSKKGNDLNQFLAGR
jgi:phosphopantetheinyl transferase (holo-ACP synthase)